MQTGINISDTQASVQKALRWSNQQYAAFQYEMGVEYLHMYIPDDIEGIELLERCRFFWKWWIKRWSDRDAEFLAATKDMSIMDWETAYRNMHEPATLSNRIYPGKIIWKQVLKLIV